MAHGRAWPNPSCRKLGFEFFADWLIWSAREVTGSLLGSSRSNQTPQSRAGVGTRRAPARSRVPAMTSAPCRLQAFSGVRAAQGESSDLEEASRVP